MRAPRGQDQVEGQGRDRTRPEVEVGVRQAEAIRAEERRWTWGSCQCWQRRCEVTLRLTSLMREEPAPAIPQAPVPQALTCSRNLEAWRAEVRLAAGRTVRPPTWPDPAALSAVPVHVLATVSSQPTGQSRAGPAVSPASQLSSPLLPRMLTELLWVQVLSAGDRMVNKHSPCPGPHRAPQFISLWLPRAAGGEPGKTLPAPGSGCRPPAIPHPAVLSLSSAFPLLPFGPTNRSLFTG